MRAFEYVAARDSRHAVALLAEHGAAARVLAGGTDLLVELKSAPGVPQVVIDISRAEDLKNIALTDEGLSIGAAVTHAAIMRSPLIRDLCPALIDAAHTIGAVQTRNLGTLGGNLVTCVPSMDSGPTLVALDALVTIAGPAGDKHMPLTRIFRRGRAKPCSSPTNCWWQIVIPKKNLGKPAAFREVRPAQGTGARAGQRRGEPVRRRADSPSFATRASRSARSRRCIIRATQAEAYLEGRAITPEAMMEAG